MQLTINGTPVAVVWEDNEATAALLDAVKKAPLTIDTSRYGGFEQVGALGVTLPRDDRRITTSPGDIMLYSGDQIVVFYGANTWAYTPLGRIVDLSAQELTEMLGGESAAILLSMTGE